jgi:hypothetical protein
MFESEPVGQATWIPFQSHLPKKKLMDSWLVGMTSLKKEKANWNGRDLEILPGGVSRAKPMPA